MSVSYHLQGKSLPSSGGLSRLVPYYLKSAMHWRNSHRVAAVRLLGVVEHDPEIEIIGLFGTLLGTAFQLFCDRPDKEWGLTDCMSFVVMQDRGIHRALTADDHLRQAGFKVLLPET